MKTRKSEVNSSFVINDTKSVISLARKANYLHEQHAFLILETIENGADAIYFMDFVGEDWFKNIPNSNIGKVRLERYSRSEGVEAKQSDHKGDFKVDTETSLSKPISSNEKLIFKCKRRMMDLTPNDKIASKQWYIESHKASELIKLVKEQVDDPNSKNKKRYPFSWFGQQNPLTGSSATLSSKEKGNNCFTWARGKLMEVGLSVENGKNTLEWINKYACITGLTTYTPRSNCFSLWSCKNLTLAGAGAAVVALSIGYNLSQ